MKFKRRENIDRIKIRLLNDTEVTTRVMKAINCMCVEFKLECVEEF